MKNTNLSYVIFCITFLLMELALIWALGVAPADKMQGDVQRIFYFHLGSIWPAFLAFFYVSYASVAYLKTRDSKWDRKALASGEVGLAFCSIVLITGPIWAKPTWGVWWAWDARLVSTMVLWLTFLGYVTLRDYIDDESKRPRISAVLGIIGASMVPFVYYSTRIFETQHPKPVIMGAEEDGIKDLNMTIALVLALIAFTFLYAILSRLSHQMHEIDEGAKNLKAELNLMEDETHG